MKTARNWAIAQCALSIFLSLALLGASVQLRLAAAEIYRLRAALETAHFTYYPDVKGLECWVSSGGLSPGGEYAPPGLLCDYRDK